MENKMPWLVPSKSCRHKQAQWEQGAWPVSKSPGEGQTVDSQAQRLNATEIRSEHNKHQQMCSVKVHHHWWQWTNMSSCRLSLGPGLGLGTFFFKRKEKEVTECLLTPSHLQALANSSKCSYLLSLPRAGPASLHLPQGLTCSSSKAEAEIKAAWEQLVYHHKSFLFAN